MDFFEKIRGARAILGWSRADLSKKSGLSEPAIRVLEEGPSNPKESTRQALIKTFALEGLELTPNGVERREISLSTLGSYIEVLQDVEKTLVEGGEVLKHCADDRKSSPEVIEKIRLMRDAGIRERLTINENNSFITGNPEDYRTVPSDYFSSSEAILIYANKAAFVLGAQCLVVRSSFLSKVFKEQFEYWWKIGGKVHGA